MEILKTFKRMTIISFKLESDENDRISTQIQFTWKMVFAMFTIFQNIILTTIFLIYIAQTFTDYSETFFPWGAAIEAFVRCILLILINGENTFQLIDRIEGVINKRNKNQSVLTHIKVKCDD